ncbi:NAD(P)/FAD-dependent oxidoreductase [Haloferacaceae archaeon DSL9]
MIDDVVVVGAGAAGIGVAVALSKLDLSVRVVDREAIGASFLDWPDETRLLTPSFPGNSFGLPDLNAISPQTSPAFVLDREHPSGDGYAAYLERVADYFDLRVETGVTVTGVGREIPSTVVDATDVVDTTDTGDVPGVAPDGGVAVATDGTDGFTLETSDGPLYSRFVVWAAGEFGAPRATPFPGAEHGTHTAAVSSWAEHAAAAGGDDFVVIGGYESGVDAAVGILDADPDATVTIVDTGTPWSLRHPDPSEALSPYTKRRLDAADDERLTRVGGVRVERIDRREGGSFVVRGADGTHDERRFETPTAPILATGFEPNLGPVAERFPLEDGVVSLTDRDESPTTPGLFLSGPAVAHNGVQFCFIYKFRSRFPVVAETIGERLGVDTDPLSPYREANMFLDDLACCEPDMCDC